MAKELIAKAQNFKQKVQEEDDFFINEGVQKFDDEYDGVTRALQLDHVRLYIFKRRFF